MYDKKVFRTNKFSGHVLKECFVNFFVTNFGWVKGACA